MLSRNYRESFEGQVPSKLCTRTIALLAVKFRTSSNSKRHRINSSTHDPRSVYEYREIEGRISGDLQAHLLVFTASRIPLGY